jgi:thymidylate synthase (FAD)
MSKAELISYMGSDLTVADAARVSFNKQTTLNEDGSLREQDFKLIHYLAKHGHFTPFTHPQITMRETVPIFVARQRFKHVVGFTYNEVSRRYVDDTPEFYSPDVWRSRPDASMKQGSGEGLIFDLDEKFPFIVFDEDGRNFCAQRTTNIIELHSAYSEYAKKYYEALIESGVAPEQARMELPQSMMTSYYVTGSLAAWARAARLRTDSHAQKEIRDLAYQWDDIINPLFPVSWAALLK